MAKHIAAEQTLCRTNRCSCIRHTIFAQMASMFPFRLEAPRGRAVWRMRARFIAIATLSIIVYHVLLSFSCVLGDFSRICIDKWKQTWYSFSYEQQGVGDNKDCSDSFRLLQVGTGGGWTQQHRGMHKAIEAPTFCGAPTSAIVTSTAWTVRAALSHTPDTGWKRLLARQQKLKLRQAIDFLNGYSPAAPWVIG